MSLCLQKLFTLVLRNLFAALLFQVTHVNPFCFYYLKNQIKIVLF